MHSLNQVSLSHVHTLAVPLNGVPVGNKGTSLLLQLLLIWVQLDLAG